MSQLFMAVSKLCTKVIIVFECELVPALMYRYGNGMVKICHGCISNF